MEESQCRSCYDYFRGSRGISLHLRKNPICNAFYASKDSKQAATQRRKVVLPHSIDTAARRKTRKASTWNHTAATASMRAQRPPVEIAYCQPAPNHCPPSPGADAMLDWCHNTDDDDAIGIASTNMQNEELSEGMDSESCASVAIQNQHESGDTEPFANLPSPMSSIVDHNVPDDTILLLQQQLQKIQQDEFGFDRFSLEDKLQLELLQILKAHRLPLSAFAPTLAFAVKLNALNISLANAPKTRKTIIGKLFQQYHMTPMAPQEKTCFLPIAKKSISVVVFSAQAVFASLLTCPFLNQDHKYMFPDPTNIFAPPLATANVGEINTGAVFIATYHKLVRDAAKDMLFPCILGMDKSFIDTGSRLTIEPIYIQHPLLKHEFRSHPSAMRILGYINLTRVHYASKNLPMDGENRMAISTAKLNDYHAQIEFILQESGFLDLQAHGFSWNLHFGGAVYPVTFRMYVPFIIGDTEGHDRLCGHYIARFQKVKQLCRTCKCPTKYSHWSKANFKLRYSAEICQLIAAKDAQGLQAMSQNYLLRNAFDAVRFGWRLSRTPNRGIFGACPGEILHLILLGWFKYLLEAFVKQLGGEKAVATLRFDELCAYIGELLQRQSDREVPRTNFPKGFATGANVKGHEMVGCLLVMLFAIQTSHFEYIMSAPKDKKPGHLGNAQHRADWIMLLESLLQWHQWLKEPIMTKQVVSRSRRTTRWLMRHFQKIAPRESGMKYNLVKFHLVTHMADDILDHGVPQNVNSAFMETAHISMVKHTARKTQKRASSFTYQAAKRYVEDLVLNLALYETGQQALTGPVGGVTHNEAVPRAAGLYTAHATVLEGTTERRVMYTWHSVLRQKDQNAGTLTHEALLTKFLLKRILRHAPLGFKLSCFTEFSIPVPGDPPSWQLFRTHPWYQGRPWYDFGLVSTTAIDLVTGQEAVEESDLPARFYGFVDLQNQDVCDMVNWNTADNMNDHHELTPQFYAICALFDRAPARNDYNEETTATILGMFRRREHATHEPRLYLIPTSKIIEPMFGMHDVEVQPLPTKRSQLKLPTTEEEPFYLFFIKPRHCWARCWEDRIMARVSRDEEESEEEGDQLAVEDADKSDTDDGDADADGYVNDEYDGNRNVAENNDSE